MNVRYVEDSNWKGYSVYNNYHYVAFNNLFNQQEFACKSPYYSYNCCNYYWVIRTNYNPPLAKYIFCVNANGCVNGRN